jgi:uncharacterized protein YihD (DUF1040 family)
MIILEKFDSVKEFKEFKALRYAERFGIIEYEVALNYMTYEEKLPNEGTFRHLYNLITDETMVYKIALADWEKRV